MESKRKSLEWAIDELEKQKGIISSKLEIANKREQTSSIIAEVNAQKDALLEKITTLEEGLKTTTELVADPLIKLEEELDCVTDKLEIAKDRLVSLEQEQYLEELGKKLNGEFIPEQETFSESITSKNSTFDNTKQEQLELASKHNNDKSDTTNATQSENSSQVIMKATKNRIDPKSEEESSTMRIQSNLESVEKSESKTSPTCDFKNLEECAKHLGVDQEFLLEQGMQAILRMIARNGNKISFPLEVDQID